MKRTTARRLAGLLVAATWAGCRTRAAEPPPDPARRVDAGEGNRPFYAGEAATRAEVVALVEELRAARGEQVVDVGTRLVRKGEPAVPALREALRDPDAALRANAAWLLGVLKDRRTVDDLRVVAERDADPVVRYEAAAALLELQDPSAFRVLVDGLADRDARRRAKCIDVLAEKTGERFGFEPDGEPDERNAAIRRWRAWLAVRAQDPACPPDGATAPADEGGGGASRRGDGSPRR